jgi:hypothetical protein
VTEHDRTLARVIETLRQDVRIDPDLNRRVMAEIERWPQPGTARDHGPRLAWLRRRRIIRLSPLGGLAAAATLAAVAFALSRMPGPGGVQPPAPASDRPASAALTQFVLVAPEAASVAVVGDFNDWSFSATPLERQPGDDVWWVTLPLRPGRYRYAFVVNGTSWRPDPNAPAAEDEFGRPNSVVTIGGA